MEEKVSVIIPTYSRSDNLCRAIDSVLKQSYKNIEIIVVDDNDEKSNYRKQNERIMNQYQNEKRVIYIKHKINQNGAVARNTGIKTCTGDYITFLDDDDVFIKGRIKELVEIMKLNKDYEGVYTNVAIVTNNVLKKYVKVCLEEEQYFDLTLGLESIIGTGSNMFFRKEAIEKIGLFDIEFFRHQDMEYLARFFINNFKLMPYDKLLVIKNNDDVINVPNSIRSFEIKKMYMEKFQMHIMNSKRKHKILTNIFKQCIIDSILESNTECLRLIKEYALKNWSFNVEKIYFKQKIRILLKYKRKRNIILNEDDKCVLRDFNIVY